MTAKKRPTKKAAATKPRAARKPPIVATCESYTTNLGLPADGVLRNWETGRPMQVRHIDPRDSFRNEITKISLQFVMGQSCIPADCGGEIVRDDQHFIDVGRRAALIVNALFGSLGPAKTEAAK